MNAKESKFSKATLTRVIGTALSVIGFIGMFAVKSIFDGKIDAFILSNGFVPVSYDNFYLFFNISTVITAVLLALTLLSAATYVFQKERPSAFTFATVTLSPIICAAAIIMVSVFYSYLTHGSECTILQYILLLGMFESLLFALPFSITKAHRMIFDKTPKKRKIKKSTK